MSDDAELDRIREDIDKVWTAINKLIEDFHNLELTGTKKYWELINSQQELFRKALDAVPAGFEKQEAKTLRRREVTWITITGWIGLAAVVLDVLWRVIEILPKGVVHVG